MINTKFSRVHKLAANNIEILVEIIAVYSKDNIYTWPANISNYLTFLKKITVLCLIQW